MHSFSLIPLLSLMGCTMSLLVSAAPVVERAANWVLAPTPCIAEGTTGRALSAVSTTSPNMTVALCQSFCSNAGYPLAGLEFSNECYCGALLGNGASLSVSGNCYMKAAGDQTQAAGGPGALTLYVNKGAYMATTLSADYTSSPSLQAQAIPAGWSATGCYAEATNGRALDNDQTSSSYMTISSCLNYCGSKGFAFAGLEYGSQCFCDDRNVATALPAASCNMPCSGGPSITCGGPSAIAVYTNPKYATTATKSNSIYARQGCYQEVSGRALTGPSKVDPKMTIDMCTSFCQTQAIAKNVSTYKYAAIEYGTECYCSSTLSNGASLQKYSTQCNMACPGNSAQNCGGPNALNLFSLQ